MDFLKSKKFLVTVVSALLVAFNDRLGINLTPDQINSITMIIVGYLVGQAYVDSKQ